MRRVALILAQEALLRAAAACARAAGIPCNSTVVVEFGRWYEHGRTVVWPEGHPHGGAVTANVDRVERGAVFTVAWWNSCEGTGEVYVALTAREVTGPEADRLRQEEAEREAAWERESGG